MIKHQAHEAAIASAHNEQIHEEMLNLRRDGYFLAKKYENSQMLIDDLNSQVMQS